MRGPRETGSSHLWATAVGLTAFALVSLVVYAGSPAALTVSAFAAGLALGVVGADWLPNTALWRQRRRALRASRVNRRSATGWRMAP